MRALWHRLLCFLKFRDDFDYAPPFAPEVNHPYYADDKLRCCAHCGAGERHAIHQTPWDMKRKAEVEAIELERATARATVATNYDTW